MAEAPRPHAIADAVDRAAVRLRGHVLRTPLVPCPWLAEELGTEVRWKLENVQLTGSFKLRGASNALLCMDAAERARGVVTASSGNHGLGVATAAGRLGVPARVFVPSTTPVAKRTAIERAGADVEVHGDDCVQTERHAREVAARAHARYISPYNDRDVVAGQGTVAVELLADWPEVEVLYVALGGGGLAAGMAAWMHLHHPDVEVVACSPARSPAMAECVRRGAIVDVACHDTWSDSTAGGVEPGAITFELCRELVDRFIEVDEPQIEAAMRAALARQHLLIEGAAGVAVAAARCDRRLAGRPTAVVICGANLPYSRLQQLVRTD